MLLLAVAVQDDDTADDTDDFRTGRLRQFLGRLFRGDRRGLEEHADFDELSGGERLIDLFIEGLGQTALADLENGFQMVGLCAEGRSFFTGHSVVTPWNCNHRSS